jgi:hypothetical protein
MGAHLLHHPRCERRVEYLEQLPHPAAEMPDISSIQVPAAFESEFPGASRSAAELAANLAHASMALVAQIERPPREAHGLSARAFQTLSILDGPTSPCRAGHRQAAAR